MIRTPKHVSKTKTLISYARWTNHYLKNRTEAVSLFGDASVKLVRIDF